MTHLPFYIAHRYLFAKKSHRVVNIISMISLFGYCIGTAALVIVLSAFNGFEGLITNQYNQFDPDLKITPVKGKTFIPNEKIENYLNENPQIAAYSNVLEEQALLLYNGKQNRALLKGVTENYPDVTGIDSLMLHGEFALKKGDTNGAVIGMGLAHTIGAGLKFINALVIYAPKRVGQISLVNPGNNYTTNYFFPTGFFAVYQPEIDDQYMFADLSVVQELFQYTNEISAIEIRLENAGAINNVKNDLSQKLGNDFLVQDRYEQKADLYRMFTMEKWIASFIVIFILIIAIFNIVGTLSMLIIEKKKDILTLQSIGANDKLIRRIFFTEGGLIAFLGALSGLILGLVACLAQQQFGLIQLGTSGQFIVDAYPIEILPLDLLFIFITVIIIGIFSVYFPVKYICKRFEI